MAMVGDDKAGYDVELDGRTVRVQGWGFWREDVASGFDEAIAGFCQAKAHGGIVEIDFDRLKPMRQEGQNAFLRLLEALPGLGVTRIRIKAGSDLTRLQLVRLVGSAQLGDVVQIA
jgi:hypothetical protein